MTGTGKGSESGDEIVVGEYDGSGGRFSWATGGETMRWSIVCRVGWCGASYGVGGRGEEDPPSREGRTWDLRGVGSLGLYGKRDLCPMRR